MKPSQRTLPQTIAHYYQLGKKPVPYATTNATEALMTLYLMDKYKIYDPELDEFRGEYCKGVSDPDYCNWDLSVVYDKNRKLIQSNKEDYYSMFYWKLREIIEMNPGKKVACLFNISFIENGICEGHSEIVLYDPLLNILQHIDSNNMPKQCARKAHTYFDLCEIVNDILQRVANALPTVPRYINNETIYSRYEWGIQSMEASSDQHTPSEKEGYCLMWAVFFGDLLLAFPEYSGSDLVDIIKKKAKSTSVKTAFENDYMLTLIRGYVVSIARELDVAFDDESSKHRACAFLSRKQI